MAQRSEGLGLSPVEFAVPMSEQATAGHGPDLLGLPIVIEGSPEALQTAAILAPTTSQVITGTEADIGSTDEQTGTPDTMVAHPASSVYGAGAAGSATISFRQDPTITSTDPLLTYRDTTATISSDPSLAPNVVIRPTASSTFTYSTFAQHEPSIFTQPRLYSSTQTAYDVEQSQSALGNIGQFVSERSSIAGTKMIPPASDKAPQTQPRLPSHTKK